MANNDVGTVRVAVHAELERMIDQDVGDIQGAQPLHYTEQTGQQSIYSLNDPRLASKSKKCYKTYREMRLDPTIKISRAVAIAPVLTAAWSVEAEDCAPDGADEFIDSIAQPLRMRYLKHSMEGKIDYGWQPFEKVHKYINHGKYAGMISVEKLKPLLQDITTVLIDVTTGEFQGYEQTSFTSLVNPVLALKNSLHVVVAMEGTDWYGEPDMEAARVAWDNWRTVNSAANRYDEKIAGAHWVVTYPIGSSKYGAGGVMTDNYEIAVRLIASLRSSGAVAIPSGVSRFVENMNKGAENSPWSIRLEEAGNVTTQFIDRMKYLDALKCRAFGIPERAIFEGQFGTKAEAAEHADFAISNIELVHQFLCMLFNEQLVNPLLRLNYGEQYENTVKVKPAPLTDVQRTQYFELIKALIVDPGAGPMLQQRLDYDAILERVDLPLQALQAMGVGIDSGMPLDPQTDALAQQIATAVQMAFDDRGRTGQGKGKAGPQAKIDRLAPGTPANGVQGPQGGQGTGLSGPVQLGWENQPRDADGKWSNGGASTATKNPPHGMSDRAIHARAVREGLTYGQRLRQQGQSGPEAHREVEKEINRIEKNLLAWREANPGKVHPGTFDDHIRQDREVEAAQPFGEMRPVGVTREEARSHAERLQDMSKEAIAVAKLREDRSRREVMKEEGRLLEPPKGLPDNITPAHALNLVGLSKDVLTEGQHGGRTLGVQVRDMRDEDGYGVVRVDITGYHPEAGLVQANRSYYANESKEEGHTVTNSYFKIENTGGGFGASVLARQVEESADAGFHKIETYAAWAPLETDPDTGKKFREYNGYYTWAALGYDGNIPSNVRSTLSRKGVLPADRKISSLMATEEGRQAWSKHGRDWEGTFDLTEGSYSRSTMDAYIEKKGIKLSFASKAHSDFANELTPWDDTIGDSEGILAKGDLAILAEIHDEMRDKKNNKKD